MGKCSIAPACTPPKFRVFEFRCISLSLTLHNYSPNKDRLGPKTLQRVEDNISLSMQLV